MATTAPALGGAEAVRTAVALGYPAVASGVIVRRRRAMAALEKLHADESTLRAVRGLRARFGDGPVELRLPGRRVAVVLDPGDVGRVLGESPEPFTPANREKIGALSPFQPRGVLITRGGLRPERRRFNEEILDAERALHRLAPQIDDVVGRETAALLDGATATGRMDADEFTGAWWRIVRQVVLGAGARSDHGVTGRLARLRSAGNWSYLAPRMRRLRDRFDEDLYRYVAAADPDSLAGVLAASPAHGSVDPVGQIPHWLFAFDAAGMACLRAMALLASHPPALARGVAEVDAAGDGPQHYPFLRSVLLESVRLWPTTPAILRDSMRPTRWGPPGAEFTLDAGTAFVIMASAFHRDAETLPFADRFAPEVWETDEAQRYPQLVPFSAGPARCPGRNLVLQVTSTVLARLLGRAHLEVTSSPRLGPDRPLPLGLNNFGLRFAMRPRAAARAPR